MRVLIIAGITVGALMAVVLIICIAGVFLSCYYSIPYDEWVKSVKTLEEDRQKTELRKRGRRKRWELWRKRLTSFWRSWKRGA